MQVILLHRPQRDYCTDNCSQMRRGHGWNFTRLTRPRASSRSILAAAARWSTLLLGTWKVLRSTDLSIHLIGIILHSAALAAPFLAGGNTSAVLCLRPSSAAARRPPFLMSHGCQSPTHYPTTNEPATRLWFVNLVGKGSDVRGRYACSRREE